MTTTVRLFDGSGNEAVLNAPDGPTDIQAVPKYSVGTTAAGGQVSYKMNDADRSLWNLRFRSLTTQQYQALLDFFTAVGGPGGAFGYTHTSNVTYDTCRFADRGINGERIDDKTWGCTFTLRVDAAIRS